MGVLVEHRWTIAGVNIDIDSLCSLQAMLKCSTWFWGHGLGKWKWFGGIAMEWQASVPARPELERKRAALKMLTSAGRAAFVARHVLLKSLHACTNSGKARAWPPNHEMLTRDLVGTPGMYRSPNPTHLYGLSGET